MTPESIDVIGRVQQLRTFGGTPREFWPAYAAALHALAGAKRTAILTRRAARDGGAWQTLGAEGGAWPVALEELFALAETVGAEGAAERRLAGRVVSGVEIATGEDDRSCVALFESVRESGETDFSRVRLAADVPLAYRQAALLRQSREDLAGFANTLDLLAVLRGRERFLEAAMTLCNELATRHRCHQVALGWLDGRYVVLQALSHRDVFDRKMEAVQRIEAAMEEALDQDDEIVWPVSEARAAQVTHDHARCAATLRARHLVSVPLRASRRLIGALWLERAEGAFDDAELRTLRVEADQVAEPLLHLRRRDRWWGARWKGDIEEAVRRRWNLEHPWLKLGGLLAAVALAFACLVPLRYRVEATFVVRPAEQTLLGAAYDGYLDRVAVTAGDVVTTGQELFALDDATWRMQAAALEADASRYRAEAEQAQGQGRRAEMRIALAQEQQTLAQLELVKLNLAGAVVRAPFDGIVVEDASLRERIGAAVTRGDVLLRVARAGSLFVELDVPEHAVDDVANGARGELAFATRPEESFPLRIERIEPAAVAKAEGGVFPTRARFADAPPTWTRPGMTGVAKIEAGRRTALWQLTHRLVDWVRMKLWW